VFDGAMAVVVTRSCGARVAPLSRLATSINDRVVVPRSSMLTGPLPETSGVTLTDTQLPAEKPPLEPTIDGAGDGALFHVIPLSAHEVFGTPLTLNPRVSPSSA
jgi:hypothetical protein